MTKSNFSLKNFFPIHAIILLFFVIGSLHLQAQDVPPPTPNGKKADSSQFYQEMVFNLSEGLQGKMFEQISHSLREDVEIYLFPNKLKAKGTIEAKIFFEDFFADEEMMLMRDNLLNIGLTRIVSFNRMPPTPGKEKIAIIVEYKGEKIWKLYFLNN